MQLLVIFSIMIMLVLLTFISGFYLTIINTLLVINNIPCINFKKTF